MPFWRKDRIPLPEFKEDLDKLYTEITSQFPQFSSSLNTTIGLVEAYYFNVFGSDYHPFNFRDKDISFEQKLYNTLADHLALTCAQQMDTPSPSRLSKLEDLSSSSENQFYDFASHHFSTPGLNPQNFRATLEAAKLWVSLLAIHGENGLNIKGRKNIQFKDLITDLEDYFETGNFRTVQTALGERLGMHKLDWEHIRTSR